MNSKSLCFFVFFLFSIVYVRLIVRRNRFTVSDNNEGEFLRPVPSAASACAAAPVLGPFRRGIVVETVRAPVIGHGLAAEPRADRVRGRAIDPQPVRAREPSATGRSHRRRVRPETGVRVHHGVAAAVRGPAGVLGPGTRGRRTVDHQHPAHCRRRLAGRFAVAAGRRAEARVGLDRQQAHVAQPVDSVLQLHHVGKLRYKRLERRVVLCENDNVFFRLCFSSLARRIGP